MAPTLHPELAALPARFRGAMETLLGEKEHARQAAEERARQADLRIKLLEEALRQMRIEKYGASSEKLSNLQLTLLETEPSVCAGEVEAEAAKTSAADEQALRRRFAKKAHPGREELPAHLPRKEQIVACPPEACQCAQCGAEKKVIGFECSEQLDCLPAQYFVLVTKREKRACARCEEQGVSVAPVPARAVEKSKLSDRIIVQATIAKYCDHQPIYRQVAELERDAGVVLSRGTLCGLIFQVGERLQPIAQVLRAELLSGGYIQADETPVALQSGAGTGRNHQAYLWQYGRPHGPVVFDFQRGRGRDGPARWLGDFCGVLQNDGYGVYEQVGGEKVKRACCWAHARRYFVQAHELAAGGPSPAEAVLREIAALYAIEQQAREAGLDAAARLALRQAQSAPILARLKELIIATRQGALPKHALGKACDYTLKLWARLAYFAEDGQVEIDNNWAENAIRPVALGRKNWLHIGSEEAGTRIAAIMSVIATCQRLKIPIRAYLEEVLPQIADWPQARIAELSPLAWVAARNAR